MEDVMLLEIVSTLIYGADKLPTTLTAEEKKQLLEKAYSSLILGLGDKVLREVKKETTASGNWGKLETLYMSKAVPNRIHLKQKFFGFKMDERKSLVDNMDGFKKLIQDLESMSIEMNDEDQAVILLNSLPKPYENFVDTLKYGRQTIKLEEIEAAIIAKDVESRSNGKTDAEGLIVRGRTEKKWFKRNAAVAAPKILDKTTLWHRRLAHVSEKGLMELSKQGLLCGDKLDKLSFCDHCVYGKMIRVKFNVAKHCTQSILDYIHSDLWGPSRHVSMGGYRYFMSIIDDYSRRVWIYFMKTKDETLQKFKDWKVMIENQSGKRVKRLRTDNGLEYCNDDFNSNAPIEVEQSGFEVELTGKNFEQDHDQLQVPVQSVNDSDEVVVQYNDLEDYNLTRDRVRREVRAPNRFGYADIVAYALQVAGEVNDEPRSYQDAVTRSDSLLWKKAMSEEFESLQKNKTWILVNKPEKSAKVEYCYDVAP
ncbi:hypothetical protein EZV62_008982 [Acer yangbiense]|uniref:Integrase catalytic domain-containing protein n=1 Tax=Acer yangbiense TaxID=1000413 RepID=A0A5C7IEF7_9ROSI|nr:hypothetical protein EZV62_008982 [Acer yangbiense]